MNAPLSATVLSTGTEAPAYGVQSYIGGQTIIFQGDYYDRLDKLATLMATGKVTVPSHLRGNKADCFAIGLIAARANLDPFGVARKTWKGPNDTLEYESQLVIALINNSGLLVDRIRWEWFGLWERIVGKFVMKESRKKQDEHGENKKYLAPAWDFDKDEEGLGVRCMATLRGEAEPRVLELLMKQARVRNSTLWVEDPKQQLAYLAAKRWGRLHTPEAIMGVYSPDEFEHAEPRDMGNADVVRPQVPQELLSLGKEAAAKGIAAYQAFWRGCSQLERGLLSEASDWHEQLKEIAAKADKNRTVDSAPRTTAPAPSPAQTSTTAPSPSPAPTAAAQADPVTGETTPPAGADAGSFEPTFARVAEMMKTAADSRNEIALEIAGDWIESVEDEQQRKELTATLEAYRAQLKNPTA